MKLKKVLPMLLVGMMTFSPINVFADDIDSVQSEVNSLQESLTNVNNQLSDLDSQISEKDQQLLDLETKISEKENENNLLIDGMNLRKNHLDELNTTTEYKDLISKSQKYETSLNKMSHIKDLIDEDEKKINENNEEITKVQEEKTSIENQKQEIVTSRDSVSNEKTEIENQINEKQSVIDEYKKKKEEEKKKKQEASKQNSNWNGSVLTKSKGVNQGPSGKETYYNLNMSGVIKAMRNIGNNDEYWVRNDGCKMLGNYIMVAANLKVHPRGSLVETSLGTGIVCDTGSFANGNPNQLDIAVNW